jgi:hypothetical protein
MKINSAGNGITYLTYLCAGNYFGQGYRLRLLPHREHGKQRQIARATRAASNHEREVNRPLGVRTAVLTNQRL